MASDEDLDLIIEGIDELLLEGRFHAVDDYLQTTHPAVEETDVLLAVTSPTN